MAVDPTPGARERWPGLVAACVLFLIACGPPPSWPGNPQPPTTPGACTQTTGQMITLQVPSAVYRKPVAASVYLPPCYDSTLGRLPAIYLLHGGSADESQWPDLRVREEADALIAQGVAPFVVVMPGGYYAVGLDYEAFVLDELIPGSEGQLRLRSDGAGRAIGGISLGGYWALKTAFQYPGLFAAAGGHSPVAARGGADDPLALASTAQGLDHLLITLDAGDQDSLAASTQQLADVLSGRGLAVTLAISPGAHNRPYWRSHTGEYLRFYVNAMAPVRSGDDGPSHPAHAR